MALLEQFGEKEEAELLDFLCDVFPEEYGASLGSEQTEVLCDPAVDGFLSELLGGAVCGGPESSPGSDSGISEGVAGIWGWSPPRSPPRSPIIVRSEHNYSLSCGELQSCSLTCDGDVSIDLDVCADQPEGAEPIALCMEEEEEETTYLCQYPGQTIQLTEEESRLLGKEGIALPTHLPLTKAEERALKRVRRKIRNKFSAQESRKKKKEYVDGLESRVATCSVHNQELQKKVHRLQNDNMWLRQQVRTLQELLRQTGTKTSASSTCIMVLALSFCLILFPSLYPFGTNIGGPPGQRGVVSRQLRDLRSDLPVVGSEVPEEQEVRLDPVGAGPARHDTLLDVTQDGVRLEAELRGAQNDTPEVRDVGTAESKPSSVSNSSADLPKQTPPGGEGHPEPRPPPLSDPPELLPVDKAEGWVESSRSVILGGGGVAHRSDEM